MNAAVDDEAFFFASQGARLYGVLHRGSAPRAGEGAALGCVVVHPFMEERQDSHAVLRDLALRLAATGVPALRLDLFGCGDSEGEWGEATIERWLDDLHAAHEELQRRTGCASVMFLGLRFGATLAGLAARRCGAARLVMVQPLVRGDAYVMDLLLAHLAAEMVLHRKVGLARESLVGELDAGRSVNLFGYQLTAAQYREICAIDLARDLAGFSGPALVVDVARTSSARENKDLVALVAALGATATLARAVEAQTLYAESKRHYTQAEDVARVVLAWMQE